MVISLSSNLFDNLNNLQDVIYLLATFSDNRRYSYFCEFSEVRDKELFKNLPPIHKELIEQNFNQLITESKKTDYNIDLNSSDESFNIKEAKRFFVDPFIIVLENSFNDSYFLDALIKQFRKRSKVIKRHKDNGWLKYGNGGGCENIINFINGEMSAYNEFPKEKFLYLKCFVLIDSDKKYPTCDLDPARKKLINFLIKNKVPYHELEKREMENYLPNEVIESLPEIDNYLKVYLQLSPIQQDYFDLEKGFDNKNLSSLHPEIQALYSNLKEDQVSELRKGMTIERFEKFKKFKSEFPKLFESDYVTQDGLKKRVYHQQKNDKGLVELEIILDKITSKL